MHDLSQDNDSHGHSEVAVDFEHKNPRLLKL